MADVTEIFVIEANHPGGEWYTVVHYDSEKLANEFVTRRMKEKWSKTQYRVVRFVRGE